MYVGKTLFAQVMEFVPWTSFARIVQRHGGNSGVRTLSCAEQFRAMAFAQLTWRQSLRDIETTLSANASKLYAMGFRSAVRRSTLADANEVRDWRIWSDLAALLVRRARRLYASESALGVDLDSTVHALDSSTIDLCLSLFAWAPFRSTKAAIKLHTLLDLRGAIPAFIHISDGKLHDVNVLDLRTSRWPLTGPSALHLTTSAIKKTPPRQRIKADLHRRQQSWKRMTKIVAHWLPSPHICHPYPNQRLIVTT
jgi:hypothetical protein